MEFGSLEEILHAHHEIENNVRFNSDVISMVSAPLLSQNKAHKRNAPLDSNETLEPAAADPICKQSFKTAGKKPSCTF